MIPLIEELVLKYGWLTQEQFYDFIGVCESTPGPVAVNMATYIGANEGGILGSVLAVLGVVLPSFIIILLISMILKNITENRFFKGFVLGVHPVIAALILSTGIILTFKNFGYVSLKEFNTDIISIVIFALIAIIYYVSLKFFKKKMSAVQVIILSAVLGIGISSIKNLI